MSSTARRSEPVPMCRIGWILVKGDEMAPSMWVDKAQAEAQARLFGPEFSVQGIYVPKSCLPSPRNEPKSGRKP